MKKLTATEKTIARLRARRENLLAEVATIDRMLAAAEGKSAAPSIVVSPLVPAPPPAPLPFYPVFPQVVPFYPRPDVTGPFPGFPHYDTIICTGADATLLAGTRIDSMPSLTVGLGGSTLVVSAGSRHFDTLPPSSAGYPTGAN